jgi:hypothetical protein
MNDTNKSHKSEASQDAPTSDAITNYTPRSASPSKPEPSPISVAIDNFLHRALDIRACLLTYMPQALAMMNQRTAKAKQELDEAAALLNDPDRATQIQAIKTILPAIRRIERHTRSRIPDVLQASLFLGLFSAFDAFTGELLKAIYTKKPELFKNIRREVTISEIMQHSSLQTLQAKILDEEIEAFRRKSYVEQFDDLEKMFGITLKKFAEWPAFVEYGQRRNLFTHCDGVVSEQ